MAEVAIHQSRTNKGIALSPAFTAPAEITFDNHSPASALSELDASLDFDGFGDLQYLLEPQFAESPMHSNSRLLDGMDQVLSSPDLSPIKLPPSSFTTPVKNRTIVNITASSAVGQAVPALSTCSTDSRQDYGSTDSRGTRARLPRRAAAAAALEQSYFRFGSTSPDGITDASPSPLTKDDEHGEMDMGMDFDLLDSDAEKKSGQKRPRRRVIVETKDANGRAYTPNEIRRMKRRITNRESARRMRLKRQEEWAAIKRQARAMREQVQNMGAKQAALVAQNDTLSREVKHWRGLWEQSASANHDLTQRLAAFAIDRQVDGCLVGVGEGHSLSDEVMHVDALLKDPTAVAEPLMGRAHSCAVPSSPSAHTYGNLPCNTLQRRAASTPEALPDFLVAAGVPTGLGCPDDADGMSGALAALEEQARLFEDQFDEQNLADFLDM